MTKNRSYANATKLTWSLPETVVLSMRTKPCTRTLSTHVSTFGPEKPTPEKIMAALKKANIFDAVDIVQVNYNTIEICSKTPTQKASMLTTGFRYENRQIAMRDPVKKVDRTFTRDDNR